MKLFLLIYLILFYGLAVFWRGFLTWQKTGINPYRLHHATGIYGYLTQLYQLVSFGTVAAVFWYALAPPSWYVYLAPLTWLESTAVTAVGLALLLFAFFWVLIAQSQMGASWRIGIDQDHKTELVTHGIYRFSRNPIFLGMRASLLGLFLVMPNALTLILWLLGDVSIQIQVFLEEEHLQKQHGEAYQRYQAETSRYLGFPKRTRKNFA